MSPLPFFHLASASVIGGHGQSRVAAVMGGHGQSHVPAVMGGYRQFHVAAVMVSVNCQLDKI